MELPELRYFRTVVESGRFRQAAVKLVVAQPWLLRIDALHQQQRPSSLRRMLAAAAAAGAMLGAASAATAQTANETPQPSRGPGVGGTDPQPGDVIRERENPDMLNPPLTDSGTTPNLRFSFADAHVRQTEGGWTR